ncbi:MAG TPA: alpha/beta fold hydrolase [Streptosporangiaceae bacterium]|jgi:pimeloyl-ACP methyl ester carboxylesterase|nr:alpha/beta fold hydrolase [Streptosporangiaceae bacterium]
MLAPKAEPGTWVSDAARDKFMAAYDRAFARWPQPYEEFDLETATTTTRVHAYRPQAGGPPIVLLPPAGFNASYGYLHVQALAQAGPVFAIDMPGDPNPSVARAPLTPPDACAAWLDELLGQLGDRPAHLVGASYGGWVAMNQAIRAPARVASITLLDPAGLTKLDARWWWWFSISGLATLTPMPLRRQLARWLDSPIMLEQDLIKLMWAGSRGFRMEPKFPGVLTDDELRAITVPVLLVTGARSAMLTPAEARARGRLMPQAEVAIVPGSHGGFDRVDELNSRMVAFIAAHSQAPAPGAN